MNGSGDILLDTSVIVDYLRGDERLRARFLASATLYVPFIVLGELWFGAQRSLRPEQSLASVREFMTTASLVLPNERTAEEYGQIRFELSRAGRPIPENDIWIAAIARQQSLPIVTRDAHFGAVARLKVMFW